MSKNMASWDLKETHSLVRLAFGNEQEKLVQECTRSVNDRKAFSSYHFKETIRLTKSFERKHLNGELSILKLHGDSAFDSFMVKAGAHSIATVQSLHAIPDIFAHAIYFASGQNLQPYALPDHNISLPSVVSCINQDVDFAPLSEQLKTLQSGEGWKHLAAVSNISKHRSVVRASYNEDWTGTRENLRELQIYSFEHRGKRYPAKSLRGLLEPEYDRLIAAIVTIGNQLNSILRDRSS